MSGVAAVLVGEGVVGLTVNAETTSPVYWWISTGAGVALVAHQVWHHRTARFAASVLALTALGAAGFAVLSGLL